MTRESPTDRLGRSSNAALEATSFLFGANAHFIEQLYARYLADPSSVDSSWRALFEQLNDKGHSPSRPGQGPKWKSTLPRLENGEIVGALTGLWPRAESRQAGENEVRSAARDSVHAIQLVRAYRVMGHLAADLDPLRLSSRPPLPVRCRRRLRSRRR